MNLISVKDNLYNYLKPAMGKLCPVYSVELLGIPEGGGSEL